MATSALPRSCKHYTDTAVTGASGWCWVFLDFFVLCTLGKDGATVSRTPSIPPSAWANFAPRGVLRSPLCIGAGWSAGNGPKGASGTMQGRCERGTIGTSGARPPPSRLLCPRLGLRPHILLGPRPTRYSHTRAGPSCLSEHLPTAARGRGVLGTSPRRGPRSAPPGIHPKIIDGPYKRTGRARAAWGRSTEKPRRHGPDLHYAHMRGPRA
jgi:hypothetical protein